MLENNTTRIDKWLWAVRIYKTRSLATQRCIGGKVKVNGISIKPSKLVKPTDIVHVVKGSIKFKYKIIKSVEKRISASLIKKYLKDLTSQKELSKKNFAKTFIIDQREKGLGRPTKEERRALDKTRGKF